MGYWDDVKNRWRGMVGGASLPPKNSGTGAGTGTGTGTGSGTGSGTGRSTGTGGYPGKEWELVYLRFREIEGRDPYSFQELVDWWNRI